MQILEKKVLVKSLRQKHLKFSERLRNAQNRVFNIKFFF